MITDYETAESFVLQALENEDFYYASRSYILESAADTLINLPTNATFNEFALKHTEYGETPESVFNNPLDEADAMLLNIVLKKYHNIEAKVNRPDNWLNPAAIVNDRHDWQAGYRNALAQFLIEKGTHAKLSLNVFGWRAYEPLTAEPVAVFHVLEHYQGEFAGTFVDNDVNSGITGEVLLADGNTAYIRWEGSFSEAVRSIMSV